MVVRPRWQDEATAPDAVLRLDAPGYRIALAWEAQRIAGRLARAEEAGDATLVRRLARDLHALSSALAVDAAGPVRALAPPEAVLVGGGAAGPRLFTGAAPSLWDGLRPLVPTARSLDIVVAYATRGGVDLIAEVLARALARGLSLRVLTGCYLGGTRPDALRALLRLVEDHPSAHVRFLDDPERHFHPKVYRVADAAGGVHLFVGSSNLSRRALHGLDGAIEWNVALDADTAAALVADASQQLDALFATTGVALDARVIDAFERAAVRVLPPATMLDPEPDAAPLTPTAAQREALAGLARVREEGLARALVVAATGLGKTLLAAFDSLRVVPPGEGRVLVVAHRQELLVQARAAFERVRGRPGAHGLVHQDEKTTDAEHVYASVWSLGALTDEELASFAYVVVDEAHHGAAPTYRRLLDAVRPRFMLGLTATPERLDGGDIYALFDGVVAWEATLLDAIARAWLVPFRYFGVPDPVDYRALPWVGGGLGYREAALEAAVLREERTRQVLDALAAPDHAGTRTLVFCVSIAHARHTAEALRGAGLRTACVHSGPGADGREAAVARLRAGALDAVVAVDVFNEGVDVPELDRVVLLRPTDSPTVFLQQLGRGLRLSGDKSHLTVIDLVGNHRRARARLSLLGVDVGEVARTADGGYTRTWADGRSVSLAPAAVDAVRAVEDAAQGPRARLLAAVRDLAGAQGERPTLAEVLAYTGFATATVTRLFDSWLGLLAAAGAATADDQRLAASGASELLAVVETTGMTGPHKMVLLGAMAARGRTRMTIPEAAEAFRDFVARRHPGVAAAFVDPATGTSRLDAAGATREVPRRYPMSVLVEAHPRWFSLRDDVFAIRVPPDVAPDLLLAAVAERCDARLYDFVRRRPAAEAVVGRVIPQGSGGLCLMLTEQDARRLGAGGSWIRLDVAGAVYAAWVMKTAINVIRERAEDGPNLARAVLCRAVGAEDVAQARQRRLVLWPRGDGVWDAERA